jgi:muconolactone delta-isomerase
MEYLVTMTTQVPGGTSEQAVEDIRTREAAHSSELAAQGQLLRLWRPPLQPGEWRTLGLFSAEDGAALEGILASMPLRVWRTDVVTALAPHPNDPGRQTDKPESPENETGRNEFLTTFTAVLPADTAPDTLEDMNKREADRDRELAAQGHLERLWGLETEGQTLGLWRASDMGEMNAVLATLPLYPWMTMQTTPLSAHPNDPARTSA